MTPLLMQLVIVEETNIYQLFIPRVKISFVFYYCGAALWMYEASAVIC